MPKDRFDQRSPFDRLNEAASVVELPRADSVIPQVEPLDLWQIVIAGSIDIRQHHPLWYHQIGCIDDGELKIATNSLAIFMPHVGPGIPQQQPGIIQFDIGAFGISVVPDKWTIQTVAEKNCGRMIDVVSEVFDKKLYEIGIVAYGVNKSWSAKLEKNTAKQFLADKISDTDLSLPKGNGEGQIVYTHHLGDSDTTIQLAPAPFGDKYLTVLHNRHHPIKRPTPPIEKLEYFDLGTLIKENAIPDWGFASQYQSDLAKCILRAEDKQHGDK